MIDERAESTLAPPFDSEHILVRRPLESRLHFLAASLQFVIARKSSLLVENAVLRKELVDARCALQRAGEEKTLLYATLVHGIADQANQGGTPHSKHHHRRIFLEANQAAFFIGHLLRPFGLDKYWSETGLTLPVDDLREAPDLSTSEKVLLLAAHDLLAEDPGLAFLDIVEHLRGDALGALCAFVAAIAAGTDAVEKWAILQSSPLSTLRS